MVYKPILGKPSHCILYYSKLVIEKLFVREFRALDQILKALSKFPPKLDEECVQERATRKWYNTMVDGRRDANPVRGPRKTAMVVISQHIYQTIYFVPTTFQRLS